ncbi:MAG: phage terminase large subunit [Tidjanibacter sp.]|nr:phage terminase large subunit [Tidjanibacter sp.]
MTLTDFAARMFPSFRATPFHARYYALLEAFAEGRIRRLMITIPPQHGKSLGSSVLLPSYLLGRNPKLHIAIASYSASLAQKFNKRVQRLIDSPAYGEIFPYTTIKAAGRSGSWQRTSELTEIVGQGGDLVAVGREGSLTGNPVDIFIIDDLYKDAMEANSPTVRDNCWDWYTSVVRTREHNLSQELIVFTRWHKEDLIGRIMQKERVVEIGSWSDIDKVANGDWVLLNLEAIKSTPPTELDPRGVGEALWPERHSAELLMEKRRLDGLQFEAMYQGRPSDAAGLLYGDNFQTYTTLPSDITRKGNYTDTADTGDDYLCSVCYSVGLDGLIYVEDVVYSREKMETTEPLVARMLERCGTREALIESNNGGRGFARNVQRLAPKVTIGWFHQSANKESRILSNASTVLRSIRMPLDWKEHWGDMAAHLMGYNRRFRTNRWHDAADVLTGIVESEVGRSIRKRILGSSFSIRNYVYPKERHKQASSPKPPTLTDDDYTSMAEQMGIEEAALRAVVEVECSSAGGFLASGKPRILFEGHIFWRSLKKRGIDPAPLAEANGDILYPRWTTAHYRRGEREWERFERAATISPEAAVEATSWGLFQIMGMHWQMCGCSSPSHFRTLMEQSERAQMELAMQFLKKSGILRWLKTKDWCNFALRYNGSGYRANRYDSRLEAAYQKFSHNRK